MSWRIAALVFALGGLVSSALAQQQPSPLDQIADDNIRMGQLQEAVGKLQKEGLRLQNQAVALQSALADADASQDELQDSQ